MHTRTLPLVLIAVLSMTTAIEAPKCRVQVTSKPAWLGRIVTVQPSPTCPIGTTAYIRFRSRFGSQPDSPPGYFTLKRGQKLTRRVPRDWWVEERDTYFGWDRVPERKP